MDCPERIEYEIFLQNSVSNIFIIGLLCIRQALWPMHAPLPSSPWTQRGFLEEESILWLVIFILLDEDGSWTGGVCINLWSFNLFCLSALCFRSCLGILLNGLDQGFYSSLWLYSGLSTLCYWVVVFLIKAPKWNWSCNRFNCSSSSTRTSSTLLLLFNHSTFSSYGTRRVFFTHNYVS